MCNVCCRCQVARFLLSAVAVHLDPVGMQYCTGSTAWLAACPVTTHNWAHMPCLLAIARLTAGGAPISVLTLCACCMLFNQVLDLASEVSNLAGLTARVSQLMEQLQQLQPAASHHHSQQRQQHARQRPQQQQQQHSKQQSPLEVQCSKQLRDHDCFEQVHAEYNQQQQQPLQPQPLYLVGDGIAPSHKRYASQAVMLQAPQLVRVNATRCHMLDQQGTDHHDHPQQQQQASSAAPAVGAAGVQRSSREALQRQQHQQVQSLAQQQQQQGKVMQISIHSLGSDVLMHEVRRAFPDSPRLAPLTAVVTFQFCGTAKQLMLQQWRQQQLLQVQRLFGQEGLSRGDSPQDLALLTLDDCQQQQSAAAVCPRAASAPLPPSSDMHSRQSGWGGDSSRVAGEAARASQRQQPGSSTSLEAGASPCAAAASAVGDLPGRCPCDSESGGGCGCLCSGSEMETMLGVFLAWQEVVCSFLIER